MPWTQVHCVGGPVIIHHTIAIGLHSSARMSPAMPLTKYPVSNSSQCNGGNPLSLLGILIRCVCVVSLIYMCIVCVYV